MIRINKDLADIPESLLVADEQLTHKRRKELIKKGEYINKDVFDSRYKTNDIKDKLKKLYHYKCAYCENKVEQGHVEHYRPKQIYYWLAYSWDNLMYTCPTCNEFKGTNFEIEGERAVSPDVVDDLGDINICSSQKYDKLEKPVLLNPERDNLNDVFLFDEEGHIKGNDNKRADYTIKTCRLDRDYLLDSRRKIVDEFRNKVRAEFINAETKAYKEIRLSFLVDDFVNNAMNEDLPFSAYRKVAIGWLDDMVKDILK
ncbi:MAG: TIGR02646 family protein [Prevotella sp.]|nr:TIGR02646 family protein [Prevotella sp.]